MVEPSSVNPSQPQGPTPPQGDHPATGKGAGAGWDPKPLHWLGMSFDADQTKKLWNIISQNIANQINHDKQKAIEAIKKMNPEKNQDS